MISSPAFINNEYLICQNLLYVDGNSSLPVYQEAEQVTDVRCQFVKVCSKYESEIKVHLLTKVLVLALSVSILLLLLLLAAILRFATCFCECRHTNH